MKLYCHAATKGAFGALAQLRKYRGIKAAACTVYTGWQLVGASQFCVLCNPFFLKKKRPKKRRDEKYLHIVKGVCYNGKGRSNAWQYPGYQKQ